MMRNELSKIIYASQPKLAVAWLPQFDWNDKQWACYGLESLQAVTLAGVDMKHILIVAYCAVQLSVLDLDFFSEMMNHIQSFFLGEV